jgi:hypothetical protein
VRQALSILVTDANRNKCSNAGRGGSGAAGTGAALVGTYTSASTNVIRGMRGIAGDVTLMGFPYRILGAA